MILENIETVKTIENFSSSEKKRISYMEKDNTLENSMKVSMISSSGKKYTKMTPIADWEEDLPKRRTT